VNPRPSGNAGEGLFILAGVIVAAAGWRKNEHLGEWWWRALIGTIGLCVVAALFSRTKAAPIVKGFAWITFLSACIYAIPAFQQGKKVGKTKGNTSAPKQGSLPSNPHVRKPI
jgi:hypothetical protein